MCGERYSHDSMSNSLNVEALRQPRSKACRPDFLFGNNGRASCVFDSTGGRIATSYSFEAMLAVATGLTIGLGDFSTGHATTM